ncbi:hypothetical protein Scep_016697 [Stephania cephalantha]|uniref:PRA1 family protein n=1 Tax=Stephania cephalantha TaxID=152367 RepID=A0AAP0IN31_9MAGN
MLVPCWLEPLLLTGFFSVCRTHGDSARIECNLYCLDYKRDAFCFYCRSSRHKDHDVIQIRRSSYYNVARFLRFKSLSSTHLPQESRLNPISFSRPASLSDAASRLRKNLSYFRTNYAAVLAAVLALSLLSHPLSLLLLLSLLAAWLFLYLFRPSDAPLVILGRAFSDRETLALLVLLTVFLVFLTSVGSLLDLRGFGRDGDCFPSRRV